MFDDFVWGSDWMNEKVGPEERLENHADFQFFFEHYTAPFRDRLAAAKRQIAPDEGNQTIPQIVWSGGPIEIMYVDCGRTFEGNKTWYNIFSHAFIPNQTLIILQDWGACREVPARWYNQTKQFTDSRGEELQLLHFLERGTIAMFLFPWLGRVLPGR